MRATQQYHEIIFEWLSEPHMMEFWDNSQEHKNDILNFIHGRKQHYFAGTTQVTWERDILKKALGYFTENQD